MSSWDPIATASQRGYAPRPTPFAAPERLPGCTVTTGAGGEKCGRPPVHSFTSYYGNETFHECARHDSRGTPGPLQRVQFDGSDEHSMSFSDMTADQEHEMNEWNKIFGARRKRA